MTRVPALLEAYRPRRIHSLGVWALAGFRIKASAILYEGDRVEPRLLGAAHEHAAAWLVGDPTVQQHYGVGFLGIHDGRGANQVFLDLWINENELMHTVWISTKEDPGALVHPPDDYNSVCVWDLALQAFEREAWIACVLGNPDGPDLDRYLTTTRDFHA
jgi:hypothetical protein